MRWDLFCNVIDNHGDVGVCWRLARELGERGHEVRLWIDDASALAWMAPQGHPRVAVMPWDAARSAGDPAEVVVEAFGCNPPGEFIDRLAPGSTWLNLEYLSAEPYVERSHGLRSPVREGIDKFFFYPGFTPRTGGLLREADFDARRAAFDPVAWLRTQGVEPGDATRISLFCYEPEALAALVAQLAAGPRRTQLLVTAGRAAEALRKVLRPSTGNLAVHWLPLLSQRDYDHLLWSCDINFVRGEDSFVRAIWAGRPFVWQIYPQHDGAHVAKLETFLEWLAPPPALRDFFRVWNGVAQGALPRLEPAQWQATAEAAAQRARAIPELATALEQFVRKRGRI
ncbi:elongation factor P maturation arginine rhamnosyltransferase EarP [Ramlibacter albus]|uniref:Protein-arginine rhamnosyltransferase n=1 Tax=Ramlibacter albus TaxID=2079448 RepID=A0A923MBC7_9BURK|nr:elongation factor P maturation arginine rhamnosyltransferase EarP [Ramlibacter albus]MBC5766199.1 elongation factor P maturation arginine rhamnosyltransferase EarP [Ramlibacter albus]